MLFKNFFIFYIFKTTKFNHIVLINWYFICIFLFALWVTQGSTIGNIWFELILVRSSSKQLIHVNYSASKLN